MKIALVHDWLIQLGGSERVLAELHAMFPSAPIYTLFYRPEFVRVCFPNVDVRPSRVHKIPGITRWYPYVAPLLTLAIESLDLSEYDVVISSAGFFSKGVITKPRTRHIAYCYSPSRQLWDDAHRSTQRNKQNPKSIFTRIGQHLMRLWDFQAASRVDEFIAVSQTARERIQKYYRRDASVIYPPLTADISSSLSHQEARYSKVIDKLGLRPKSYYLIISRLYPNKNIAIAVEAFTKLGYPLVIIGEGPLRKKLSARAGKNIHFIGFQPDELLPYWYRNAKAFILPQEEDFGLTAVESIAYGTLVLALRKGGATEIIQEGITGEFFDAPIPEVLAEGVFRIDKKNRHYDKEAMAATAQRFSHEQFRKSIINFVAANVSQS